MFLATLLLMSPIYDFCGMSVFEQGSAGPSKRVRYNFDTHTSRIYLRSSSDVSVKKCLGRDSVDSGSSLDSDSIYSLNLDLDFESSPGSRSKSRPTWFLELWRLL